MGDLVEFPEPRASGSVGRPGCTRDHPIPASGGSVSSPIIGTVASRRRPHGLLVAIEGLESPVRPRLADLLARWLERRGRRVHIVPWEASRALSRAAADPRTRPALSPRVAALLVAAEAAQVTAEQVGRPLAAGDAVVADRYAWTPIARAIARHGDPAWHAALYTPLPRPDLVVHLRTPIPAAVEEALDRTDDASAAGLGAGFGSFVAALGSAYDELASGAVPGPWPAPRLVLDGSVPVEHAARLARAAVRPLLDGSSGAS